MFITTMSVTNGTDGVDSMTVTSDRTIRSVLEEAGLNYSRGIIQYNGDFLANSALDSTIEDVTKNPDQKQVLRVTVKAENAVDAAIVINGGAMIVTSSATPDELKMLQKYRPAALKLYEGEGTAKKETFMVGVTDGEGCVSQKGIIFSNRTNSDGKATVTVMIPEDEADVKAWAQDYVGVAILKLRKTEAQFAAMLDDVKQEKEAVAAAITVA